MARSGGRHDAHPHSVALPLGATVTQIVGCDTPGTVRYADCDANVGNRPEVVDRAVGGPPGRFIDEPPRVQWSATAANVHAATGRCAIGPLAVAT